MNAMPFRHAATALAVAAFALVAIGSSPSAAASSKRICRQLEAELAAAGNGAASAQTRRYDAAIERQREQMAIARDQARDAGCGFALFGRRVRQCASLNARIDEMRDNLDALNAKRDRMGAGRSRDRVMASLDANGCRDDDQEIAVRRPQEDVGADRRKSMLDRLLDGDSVERIPDDQDGPAPEPQDDEAFAVPDEGGVPVEIEREDHRIVVEPDAGGEGQRAICVRTCDGYPFPASQSSYDGDPNSDQKSCEAACPGAEMQVFYSSPDDASDMVSASTGKRYSELPTANLYRTVSAPRPASCGCNIQRNFKVVAGTPPAEPAAPAPKEQGSSSLEARIEAAPIPSPRPVLTPSDGSSFVTFAPPPVAEDKRRMDRSHPVSAPTQADAKPADDGDRKVRVVGPVFLPDPKGAIDLRAPARTEVR